MEGALLDLLIEKLCEKVFDFDEIERLRAEIERQIAQNAQPRPDDKRLAGQLQRSLSRLDSNMKAAAAELKRTPHDLYDLVVADLRDLRSKRDRTLERLTEVRRRCAEKASSPGEETLERTIERLHALRNGLLDVDPILVRRSMRQIVDRIDVWFTHKENTTRRRSRFERGTISLNNSAELTDASSNSACASMSDLMVA